MSKELRDLIEAETLTFQDEEKLLAELDQLEADAELGRAVRLAFKEGFSINQLHSVLSNIDYCLYDVESLLNWAKEVTNEMRKMR